MFAEIAEEKDDYNNFNEQFGEYLKFASKSGVELLNLKERAERMNEGPNGICCSTAGQIADVPVSKIMEEIIEVLNLIPQERVDVPVPLDKKQFSKLKKVYDLRNVESIVDANP